MQKFFMSIFLAGLLYSGSAWAANDILPIKVRIVDLTQMPLSEALQFCDERNMSCPAIREKAQEKEEKSPKEEGDKVIG